MITILFSAEDEYKEEGGGGGSYVSDDENNNKSDTKEEGGGVMLADKDTDKDYNKDEDNKKEKETSFCLSTPPASSSTAHLYHLTSVVGGKIDQQHWIIILVLVLGWRGWA